ncbi:hypothetical protein [Streptomyces heilongjiangensis]|uniref:Meckel syndrome type 1 protein n=1 Tax=Streptomyces heilongjiangensis TaxID=945052 RepID=A0ABW1B597_9ACTN|nr:hypothetical protein [Streptomyces heilongjiangensis]MDC2949236.1 hypothetical protein [Streptomyces heilongjiangensis]
MPALPARCLAACALSAALLLGVSAPAATADDAGSARDRARSAAPVPDADALLAQVKGFGDLGGVLDPVTDLLNAVLKAEQGRLSAARSAELGKAARDAIARARGAASVTPSAAVSAVPSAAASAMPPVVVPVAPTALPPVAASVAPSAAVPVAPTGLSPVAVPVAPAVAVPVLRTPPVAAPVAPSVAAAPAGLVDGALASLREGVDVLLAAAVSADAATVGAAVHGVLSGVVEVVAATLLGSGLPAPTGRVPARPPVGPAPVAPPAGPVPVKPPVALSVE